MVKVPKGTTFEDINRELLTHHNLMIAGAFGYLDGKVFRVGHMGEGCSRPKLIYVLNALEKTLIKLGVSIKVGMEKVFLKSLND